jgi:hypothetical protein
MSDTKPRGVHTQDRTLVYVVQEGVESPRDGTVGWRDWHYCQTKDAAIRQAKKVAHMGRVLETRVVWESRVVGQRVDEVQS